MNIVRNKRTNKHFQKVYRSVISRQNKYFRRNVHINHEESNLRILRIKNDEQFNLEVKGYKTLPSDVCFLFYHIYTINDFSQYLNVNDSEYIITDSKTNKIICLNKLTKKLPDFINIWVVKKNSIEFLKLKVDDIFFTR